MDRLIVCKRFAGEEHDIQDFVTPNQVEVLSLFEYLKQENPYETAALCWQYLNQYVSYPANPLGQTVDKQRLITFGGAFVYDQPDDYWQFPYETIARVRWASKSGKMTMGDCADVTFAMVSVLRNQLGPNEVFACIGTHPINGEPQGHAWVVFRYELEIYYADPTHEFGKPLDLGLYVPYVYFNDIELQIEKVEITKLLGV